MTELAGGLTNTNYKVDDRRTAPSSCACSAKDAGLLAIDRENEYLNSVARRRGRRRGGGDRLPARALAAGARVHRGHDAERRGPAPRRPARDGRRRPAGACTARARFRDDFNMFDIQRRYLRLVQERGFRLPDRYLEFEPQVRRIEAAMAVRDEGTVPCNNDLLAENFIDVGDEFRLIDYEYSGNNDACFELGNVWSESNLSLDQLDELVGHYYGRPLRQQGRAGAPLGAHVEVRLDAVGVDPGRRLRHRLRLLGRGAWRSTTAPSPSSTAPTSTACSTTSSDAD